MQVYKGLSIITARPTPEDEAEAPHRLYGWLEPDDVCSAQRWRDAALAEIRAAHTAGRLPIICGGTGFYIQTLTDGLPPAPDIPQLIREDARQEVAADPAAAHARLADADPTTAARISPGDSQRLARAIEVWRAAGAIPSEVLNQPSTPPQDLIFHRMTLVPERQALYERINHRAALMADIGALSEASAFLERRLAPDLPAMKAVGLRELGAAARNEISTLDAIAATAQASRRYAKRQLTWLRNRDLDAEIWKTQYNSNLLPDLVAILKKIGLTGP
jgi:tRNA dimethylallyltransferase